MNTLIFRTIAPVVTVVMIAFAIFVTLRGHNEPGGGFIGGLIAAGAIAIYGIAMGADAARNALKFEPLAYAGFGVAIAAASGLISAMFGLPYLTGLWGEFKLGETVVAVSTPMLFDIGVFFTVFGTIAAVALTLEDSDGEAE